MLVKTVIVILLLLMIFNLFRAMQIMLRNDNKVSMSKYIGRRVLTSVIIVSLILLALATGLITPNPRPY